MQQIILYILLFFILALPYGGVLGTIEGGGATLWQARTYDSSRRPMRQHGGGIFGDNKFEWERDYLGKMESRKRAMYQPLVGMSEELWLYASTGFRAGNGSRTSVLTSPVRASGGGQKESHHLENKQGHEPCVRLHLASPCLPGPEPLKRAFQIARNSSRSIRRILACGRLREELWLTAADSGMSLVEGCVDHNLQHSSSNSAYIYTGKLYLEAGASGIEMENFGGEVVVSSGGVVGVNIGAMSSSRVIVRMTRGAIMEGGIDLSITGESLDVELGLEGSDEDRFSRIRGRRASYLNILNIDNMDKNEDKNEGAHSKLSVRSGNRWLGLSPGQVCLRDDVFCVAHRSQSLR